MKQLFYRLIRFLPQTKCTRRLHISTWIGFSAARGKCGAKNAGSGEKKVIVFISVFK